MQALEEKLTEAKDSVQDSLRRVSLVNPNATATSEKSPRNRVSTAKKKLQKSVKTLMQNNKYLFVFSIGLIGVSWILPISFIFPMAAEISSETHVYRGIVILPSEHMPAGYGK